MERRSTRASQSQSSASEWKAFFGWVLAVILALSTITGTAMSLAASPNARMWGLAIAAAGYLATIFWMEWRVQKALRIARESRSSHAIAAVGATIQPSAKTSASLANPRAYALDTCAELRSHRDSLRHCLARAEAAVQDFAEHGKWTQTANSLIRRTDEAVRLAYGMPPLGKAVYDAPVLPDKKPAASRDRMLGQTVLEVWRREHGLTAAIGAYRDKHGLSATECE